MFLRNMRSAIRGAAAGPSGMTVEHLQVLLDMPRDAWAFFQACEKLCRAQVPVPIRDAIRLGRLIALQKPNGGVRGICSWRHCQEVGGPHNVPTDDGEGASGHSSIPIFHGHQERLRMHRARFAGVDGDRPSCDRDVDRRHQRLRLDFEAGHAPGAHGFGWWQFSSPLCRTVLRHPFQVVCGKILVGGPTPSCKGKVANKEMQ